MAKTNKIIFGIPSKGRLKSQCEEFLSKKGLILKQTGGDRGYAAHFENQPDIEVRLLSSSQIAQDLLSGNLHYGITGEDLIREQNGQSDELVVLCEKLGFGGADVLVAVPDGWIDVSTMADLREVAQDLRHSMGRRLRIATKFTRLTTEFFAKHNINDYRIIYSGGATEGAPLNGIAEAIVDISSSGATLFANNLKIIDDGLILESQACLFRSKIAPNDKINPEKMEKLITLFRH